MHSLLIFGLVLSFQSAAAKEPVVAYGITFTEKYLKSLESQFYTWAAGIEDRVFPMGGPCNKKCLLDFNRLWLPSNCTDEQKLCKQLNMLEYAYHANIHRDDPQPMDYLVGIQEDHYINRAVLEKQVSQLDSESPTVNSGLGCAQSWESHPSSKGGTLNKPPNWPLQSDTNVCDYVAKNGGACGGEGIIWTRAAVKQFFHEQPPLSEWVLPNGIKAVEWTGEPDPAITCLLVDRGIKLEVAPHKPRYELRANFHKVNKNAAIIHIKDHTGGSAADHMAEIFEAMHGY